MEACTTAQRSTPRTVKGVHRFTLEKYSLCRDIGFQEHIFGSSFNLGGHVWAISVVPDARQTTVTSRVGNYMEGNVYFGIYVNLKSESDGVQCIYKISLLDQSGRGNHRTTTFFDDFPNTKPDVFKTGQITGSTNFIRRSYLEDSSYLKDDCLKIECTLEVILESGIHMMTPSVVPKQCDDVGFEFLALLETGGGSDIILNVSGKKFHAHKVILSSRSSTFQSMLHQHLVSHQTELLITGIEAQVFKVLLHFIYTDTLPDNERSMLDGYALGPSISNTVGARLLAAADQFDLRCLKSICESYLWRSISLNSFAEMLSLSERCNASELKRHCLQFACRNYDALVKLGTLAYLQNNFPSLHSEMTSFYERQATISESDKVQLPVIQDTTMTVPAKASEFASLTVRRKEKGYGDGLLKNYSRYKDIGINRMIVTRKFMVGGLQWEVAFYPCGKTVDAFNAGFASLYLCLMSETSSVVDCKFKLYFLSQSDKDKDFCFSRQVHDMITNREYGLANFIERSSLESPVYLKDDCLIFGSIIEVLMFDIQELPLIHIPDSIFQVHLGRLLEHKQGVDVFFKVADESFCAHKWILAARSPTFRSWLSNDDKQLEIVIPDIEPRIFKAILWFIYTGTFMEEKESAAFADSCLFVFQSYLGKMLAAAEKFDLRKLKKICESRMIENISEDSVGYMLHLAELYHATELKATCFRFVIANHDAFLDSDGSAYLRETCPSLYLDLAGFKEYSTGKLPTETRKVLELCNKVFSIVKKTFVSMPSPPGCTTDMQQEIEVLIKKSI